MSHNDAVKRRYSEAPDSSSSFSFAIFYNIQRPINTGKLACLLCVEASHSGSFSSASGFSSSLAQLGSSVLEPPQSPLTDLLSRISRFSKAIRGRGSSLVGLSYGTKLN